MLLLYGADPNARDKVVRNQNTFDWLTEAILLKFSPDQPPSINSPS